MEIESVVNATPEVVVEPQQTEPVADVSSEPEPDTVTETPQEPVKPEQTPEENAKFKEMRLKHEKDLEDRENAIYANLFKGQVNPYTGNEITTKAEYEAYQAQYELEQEASEKGMTTEQLTLS